MMMNSEVDAVALQNGEPHAVRAIHDAIRCIVGVLLRSGADQKEELVQESISRLLASIRVGRFRGETSLTIYAQAVARNTCLAFLRRHRIQREIAVDVLPDGPVSPGPEDTLVRAENRRRKIRALQALPPEVKELLQLVFVEEQSYQEVGIR